MKGRKYDKIKKLFKVWPLHTVAKARWLKQFGFTHKDILGYEASGWIESITHGVYKRAQDTLSWKGVIFGLQQNEPGCFHVGGRTAIDIQGGAHYIRYGHDKVLVYTHKKVSLPKWITTHGWDCEFVLVHARSLPPDLGCEEFEVGDFSIMASSRERAMLELTEGIGKFVTFQECDLIMQNLLTLRPELVQSLLENSSSVKAKRVFLFLAHRNQHSWYERLDLNKINLGKGTRQIVKDGLYDAQFKITYPKEKSDELPEF